AVDGFHVSGQNGQGGGKLAAQRGQRHARGFGDFGKADPLDRLVSEEVEKRRDDLFAIACRGGGSRLPSRSSRRVTSGSTCRSACRFRHGAILQFALNKAINR